MMIINISTRLRHYLTLILMAFSMLLYTPAQGEMTISGTSNLDTLDYDLDNIHIKLEKLESRWQLFPIDNKLSVDKLRARRLIITMRSAAKKAGDSALPEQIKLPFPIKVQQAEVVELVVITPTEQHVLNNVQFDIEADAKTIKLTRLSAGTPFGQVEATLNLGTANPFVLAGAVSIKQDAKEIAIEKVNLEKAAFNTNTVEKSSTSMPYDINVNLSGDLKQLKFESAAKLALHNGQLAVMQADVESANAAKIQVFGELGLTGEYPLKLNAQINDFQPENLGSYPVGLLNIDLDVQGNLSPEANSNGLQILLSAKDSYLQVKNQRQPFIMDGKMIFIKNQLKDVDFKASIANNTLTASGNLGSPDNGLQESVSPQNQLANNQLPKNQLIVRADLPDLTTLGNQFSGEAHVNGVVAGAFDNLAFSVDLAAQKLKLPNNIKLEKLDGKATLLAGAQGKVDATLNAAGLKMAQNPTLNANLVLQGTRAQHQLKLQAVESPSSTLDPNNLLQFETTLAGGLDAGQWQGLIQTLSLKGETPITLQAPAKLRLTSQDVALENATLQLSKGRAVIDVLNTGSKGFISKGNLSNFALDDIPSSLFKLPAHLQGNPVFSAKWDVNAVEAVNGSAIFNLESGDLTVDTNGVAKPLGLQTALADLKMQNNKIDFVLQLKGQQLGTVDAKVSTVATKVETGFALMANAPLTIVGNAQLNTLAWLPVSASLADASLDGALNLTVNADGTVQRPNLRGNAVGKNLQFLLPSQGVALTDGTLDAVFENDELHITQAAFKGGTGYLRTTGALQMENKQPKITLDWVAEQFTVISGADRLLILDGTGKTTLLEGLFSISGDFKVAKGLLALPDDDIPTLADDVVVLGQVDATAEPTLKVLLSGLHIDLGDDFKLHGRGLDAQLSGALTLLGLTQYHPYAEGSIRVKKGTYMAYGQILNITRGIISFSGPVDNPGLNIRAMRNAVSDSERIITTNAETVNNTGEITGSNFSQTTSTNVQNVNAGVEITGSGLDPRIKLVSEPNVPDTEKLSWLVLGHGTDSAGKNDFAMLSLAAGAVLSQGDSMPLQTKLARAAGLDEFGFTGSDAETASLTFGKRLSSQLYLSYVKSVSGLLDVARLTFNITPRWALQAETGTESAVDALYTFRFK
ncbi:translocation/assembly module TamB domain-containing protein [Methylotenera versatilis]|uniref:translocation/assembly module TamB domain-containing protein n=2 Tax=Methylotenera TaxID=359407 RepID=UPI000364418F|nr:translocation/assembly module TamB domain-containing protein [Methylotenera versatilis]